MGHIDRNKLIPDNQALILSRILNNPTLLLGFSEKFLLGILTDCPLM